MRNWEKLLTDYFTNMKRAHPELTEGCEVAVMVSETLHMNFDVFCEWNEISGDDFLRMQDGSCARLRRFCEAWAVPEAIDALYAQLYDTWPIGCDVDHHVSQVIGIDRVDVDLLIRSRP